MFDELYPEAADLALKTKVNRPPTAPKAPEFSTWGMFRGLGTGLPAGAAQAMASTGEMLGAFGTTLATTGGSAGGMFQLPTEAEQKQSLEATDKLIKGDELFAGGEVTRSFRNAAEGYKPDPTTTHTAEQVVFNFARVGGKAITAAMTMGNVPGAIVAGAEEGFTQAEELKQQGVDIGTRTKVGAVTAVTNAVGFALPVAGKTWLQTAGLVAVGGPGTFVTQQAATKAILENANYADLAKQYDPTDTLGLAMSVLLPGSFGALAMRGAAKSVKAKGVPPDTAPVPDAPAAPKDYPDADLVDAARVSLVRQHMDAANPMPDNVETAGAHNAAYSQALDQVAAGERVSVDVPEVVAAKAAEEIGARIDAAKQADFVEVVAKPNSDFVQAKSDAGLVGGHVRDGALHITTAEVDPAYRGQGEGIKLYIALVDDALAKGQRVFSDSTVEASAVRMYEALQRRGYEVKRLEGGSLEDGAAYGKGAKEPAFEVVGKTIEGRQGSAADASIPARDGQAAADATTSASGFNPAALAADAARFLEGGKSAAQVIGELEASGAKVSPELQNMLIGVAEFGGRINELADQVSALKAQRGAGTKPFELVAQAVENMRTGTKVEAPKPKTPTEARFADLQARNPDVMDKPMQFDVDENGNAAGPATTAREYLERIQREADQDTADASLIEVAANCFLSGGM